MEGARAARATAQGKCNARCPCPAASACSGLRHRLPDGFTIICHGGAVGEGCGEGGRPDFELALHQHKSEETFSFRH